jgi:hypothetical protein
MSKGEEKISGEHTKTGETASLKTSIITEGMFPCLLIFSEKKHVDYIYSLLQQIESILKNKGFKPQRLGDEIRSAEDYLDKLGKLTEDCVLGVIILDGFRPNVLFEFGFLMGRKPVIILKSKDAYINIKTLYQLYENSELSEKTFNNRLKNPLLDVNFHLSDFFGKHVATIDWKVRENAPDHPTNVLNEELKKNENVITEEIKKVVTRGRPDFQSPEFLQLLSRIIKLYFAVPSEFDINNIRSVHNEMVSLVKKYDLLVPYEVYSMIASTYTSRASAIKENTEEKTDCLNYAINILNEMRGSTAIEA